jgi:hypothetical protein
VSGSGSDQKSEERKRLEENIREERRPGVLGFIAPMGMFFKCLKV